MSSDDQIPVLKDLIFRGQTAIEENSRYPVEDDFEQMSEFDPELDPADNTELETDPELEQEFDVPFSSALSEDEFPQLDQLPDNEIPIETSAINDGAVNDESIDPLQIRQILNKHMDAAYAEIIELLNHRPT